LSPLSKLKRAKTLIAEAKQYETNEDFLESLNTYKEASILLPDNAMIIKKIEQLTRKTTK